MPIDSKKVYTRAREGIGEPASPMQGKAYARGRMSLTPVKAARAKCSECAGSPRAATGCEKEDCPLYPYRMGKNPARAGIGRSDLHKDAHSGKFRPSQDGRNVSISRSSEGSTPGFNQGHPREENGEVAYLPLKRRRTILRAAEAFLRVLREGGVQVEDPPGDG